MLERSVLSPFALNGNVGGIEVYSTLGQPEFESWGNDPFFLTQGFEQPLNKTPISFELISAFNQCSGLYEVTISNLTGCVVPANALFEWNGIAGDSLFVSSTASVELSISGPVGCYYSESIDLSFALPYSEGCSLIFYSYISPNEDGMNDNWIIEHIDAPLFGENTVSIMNRWGQEVWQAAEYDNATVVWSGEEKGGGALPDGTYFYKVTIGSETFNGYIELQR